MYCHLEMEGEFAYLPLFVADFANAAQTISKDNRVVGVAIEEQLGVVFCTWLLLACSFSAPFSSRSQYAYLHAKGVDSSRFYFSVIVARCSQHE